MDQFSLPCEDVLAIRLGNLIDFFGNNNIFKIKLASNK